MHNDVTKEQNVLSCYSNCFILRQATMLTEAFNQIKCAIKCVFFVGNEDLFHLVLTPKKTKKKIQNKSIALELKIIPNRIITRYFFVFFFHQTNEKNTNKIWSLRQNIQHFKRFSLFEWMRSIVDATMSLSDFKVLSSFQFEKSEQMADMHWV